MPAAELKIQQKTYYEIWEEDLSNFISTYYGKPWSLKQGEMLPGDTYRFVTVEKDTDTESGVDNWPSKEEATAEIDRWLALDHTVFDYDFQFKRDEYIDINLLMWDLCQNDIIPEGEYLILVWW